MRHTRRTVVRNASLAGAGLIGVVPLTSTVGAASSTTGLVEGAATYGSQPVADVALTFDGDRRVTTDARGAYQRELEPGTYALSVDTPGYVDASRAIDVVAGETTAVDLELEREWGPGEGEFEVYVTQVGGGSTLESR